MIILSGDKGFFLFSTCVRCKNKANNQSFYGSHATARAFLEMLAPPVQRPQKGFCDLHHRCKGPKKVFVICTTGAKAPKRFLRFAPPVQRLQKGFCDLHRWCKHFQKHFSHYSALSKTSYRNKEPHSFVELTFLNSFSNSVRGCFRPKNTPQFSTVEPLIFVRN